jgi:hypothetical protein
MSTGTTSNASVAAAAATAPYDLVVIGAAVVLSIVGTLLWGFGPEALATSLGGTLAVVNWLALRWLVTRLLGPKPVQSGRRRIVLAVLFALKLGFLIGSVWALVRWAALAPLPLALGYSALVVGLLGAAFFWGREHAAGGADA